MLPLFRVLLFVLTPIGAICQSNLDPFQVYGPYGSAVYDNYSQALLNATNCYRLKSHDQDLSKNLKKIKKLDKLYVIELKNNNIDSLPEVISTFRNLMYLKSSGNPLKKLPESIGSAPTIKSIILHHVKMDSLPDSFSNLGSLMDLEIQVNTADTFDLQDELSGLYNLKSLMIYKNNLKAFPVGLDKSKKLKKVLIVNSGLTQIDSSFGLMNDIQTLILDKNQIEDFPKEILKLKTLKELSLRENKLTSLPEGLAQIRGLEILDITGNNIPLVEIDILKALLPYCKVIF